MYFGGFSSAIAPATEALTTFGGLLSDIGIEVMDRMIQANVFATSGRAVVAAGYVVVLLLGTAYGMAIAVIALHLDARGFTKSDIGQLAAFFASGIDSLALEDFLVDKTMAAA